jgi:hypothetical protein
VQQELTYVGVELSDEAGEVAVLEVGWQQVVGEGGGVEDKEGVAGAAPAHDGVRGRVAHHVERLGDERRDGGRLLLLLLILLRASPAAAEAGVELQVLLALAAHDASTLEQVNKQVVLALAVQYSALCRARTAGEEPDKKAARPLFFHPALCVADRCGLAGFIRLLRRCGASPTCPRRYLCPGAVKEPAAASRFIYLARADLIGGLSELAGACPGAGPGARWPGARRQQMEACDLRGDVAPVVCRIVGGFGARRARDTCGGARAKCRAVSRVMASPFAGAALFFSFSVRACCAF